MKEHDINVSVRVLPAHRPFNFRMPGTSSLLEVMQTGAQQADVSLLPPAQTPLDRFHNLGKHQEVGPAITDLDQGLGDYLGIDEHTNDFGLELVRAIRVNTRWEAAPEAQMSPHQILDLF